MSELINGQWCLTTHPKGLIKETDFTWVERKVPALKDGEVRVRNIYLSLDPANRGWINPAKSVHYVKPVSIGEVMRGIGIGVIEDSNNPQFDTGEIVTGLLGWQEYLISDGKGLTSLSLFPKPEKAPLTIFLNVFGMIGLTAYFGLLDIGKPKEGETLVISAAAGAVGSLVGQIGKIKGCKVIGIAGTEKKCHWITKELGFDAAINYKTESVHTRLKELCPEGVDIYFDNVGGEILDTVLGQINRFGRIVSCGMISVYNAKERPSGIQNIVKIPSKRILIQGFIVSDYFDRMAEGLADLMEWYSEGKLTYREHIIDGLKNSPKAINKLFDGSNKGKLIIKISDEP
ncbi:MAG: NADP-dependent oxidoreductase [Candidatus Hodarchaeales archaeon]|jgi:NADPH-dependent curcumin reductase CurA